MGIGPEWKLREHLLAEDAKAPPIELSLSLSEEQTNGAHQTFSRVPQPVGDFADWNELVQTIQSCMRCDLSLTRTKTVPGVGDIQADWLFVGEGPGRDEDRQGEPFVGRAGQLLDNMLRALGIQRNENIYIANIVKCRASDKDKKDRRPTEEEAAQCMPYLQWQIQKIRPKIIVALGNTAAAALLNTDRSVNMTAMRSKVHRLEVNGASIPVVVTYHPAYLLRTTIAKKQAWADLCLAMDTFESLQDPSILNKGY